MLHLSANADANRVETVAGVPVARCPQPAEITLLRFHVATKLEPSGFQHGLGEHDLRPHSLFQCFIVNDLAEVIDSRRAEIGINGRIVFTCAIPQRNHLRNRAV